MGVSGPTRRAVGLTETIGLVQIDVPRDRECTLESKIVAKRQRRLSGVDEMVLSLYANGLTFGEISAYFAEIYGASLCRETISRISDRVPDEMSAFAEPAPGRGLRGDLHRSHRGQGPGRAENRGGGFNPVDPAVPDLTEGTQWNRFR